MHLHTHGIDIHYRVTGSHPDRPWLTLLHSLATDLRLWNELAAALTDDFNVLSFDARGHGQTSAPDEPYSLPLLADDLLGILDGLAITRTHLVGLSMGGMLGQYLALVAPTRLDKLVLVSTSSRTPPSAAALWDERIDIARKQGMSAHVEATLERWFTPAYRQAHPDKVAHVGALIAATPVAGYAGWGAAIKTLDLTDALPNIATPTLVMVGENDPGTPPAMSETIAAAIPGAKLAVIPNASHQLIIEQSVRFERLLRDFL